MIKRTVYQTKSVPSVSLGQFCVPSNTVKQSHFKVKKWYGIFRSFLPPFLLIPGLVKDLVVDKAFTLLSESNKK